MNKIVIFCLTMTFSASILAAETPAQDQPCQKWPGWFKHVCTRMHQIIYQGNNELLLTGYAWHNRYTYSKEKIKTYNENAWGGGFGKGFYDEDGDLHSLYAMAFLDSHTKVEPMAGYGFLKMAHFTPDFGAGLGFTLFITARTDMYHNAPFPGALPLAYIVYKKVAVSATYIPGAKGVGNVLFLFATYTF